MLSAAKLPILSHDQVLSRDNDMQRSRVPASDFVFGGGEMGALIRAMDWAATPLGRIDCWPQSLRTSVSLCIASNFPISLVWGPQHVQLYNDGYWPICGAKHPHSMGQDFTECWASAWPVIGDAFERARAGEAAYLENRPLFVDRFGYLEETCFTFSFSPIRDETGQIGGLFHPVIEMTSKMLSERRARTLRCLAARIGKAETLDDVLHLSVSVLAESSLDLPFVLAYRLTPGIPANLVSSCGLPPGSAASPGQIDWKNQPAPVWPLAQLTAAGIVRVDDVLQTLGEHHCGPYPEVPRTTFLIPVTAPGVSMPLAVLVAGVSARLPVNDMYQTFLAQLGATVSAATANVLAFEQERHRAEALAAIDKAKTEFFANISHEFRTPITLILGPVEDALSDASAGLPTAQRVRLNLIRGNALRLLKLVNALLEFSRYEAGRAAIEYRPTDIAGFTRELAANFESVCAKAGLKLVVDCPDLPEPVFVDRCAWESIVLNLLSNAIKFTLAGQITISLRQFRRDAVLSVSDTGIGIPDHELPRIFDRFHRVEGARGRSIEGSGIGLALVDALVKQHGGAIEISSIPGRGSLFLVRIPLGSDHLPHDRVHADSNPMGFVSRTSGFVEEVLSWLPHAEAQEGPGTAPRSASLLGGFAAHGVRVLLADDNADMLAYIKRLLEEAGCLVIAVRDGEAALAAAREQPRPDIVISDVMMPKLDGFGLLRELRADSTTADILVILLSARAGMEARLEGLAAGADDYVVKPFSARELVVRVDSALRLDAVRREVAMREQGTRTAIAMEGANAAREELQQEVCKQTRQLSDLTKESQRAAALLHTIVSTTPGPIYAKDRAGRFLLANGSALALLGRPWIDVQGRTDKEILDNPAQSEIITSNDQRIMQTGEAESIEEVVGGDNGHARVWISTKTPMRSTDGEIIGLVGVSVEITERKRDETRREMMIHELNHRVKNTLATVQAIASETLQSAHPMLRTALIGRLMTLSSVHDVLTRENWHSVDLSEVVAGALAPFGGSDSTRFQVSGPPILLQPRAAVALAMGLHELATNATKYGALHVDAGHVSLVWDTPPGVEPTFQMTWAEHDGPPVARPNQRSFGTNMIEGALACDLGGCVTIHFDSSGVRCVINAPLDEVAAGTGKLELPCISQRSM